MVRDSHNIIPVSMALLLHVIILGSMIVAFDYARPKAFTPLAIKATLVEEMPPPRTLALTSGEAQAAAAQALADLLGAIATRRPVAIVLDDFQWADSESVKWRYSKCPRSPPGPQGRARNLSPQSRLRVPLEPVRMVMVEGE